jgi:hypothetical protein
MVLNDWFALIFFSPKIFFPSGEPFDRIAPSRAFTDHGALDERVTDCVFESFLFFFWQAYGWRVVHIFIVSKSGFVERIILNFNYFFEAIGVPGPNFEKK